MLSFPVCRNMLKSGMNIRCQLSDVSLLAPINLKHSQWHHSTSVINRDFILDCTSLKDNKHIKKELQVFGTSSNVMKYLKKTKPDLVYNELVECKVTQSYPGLEVLHLLAHFFSIGKHEKGLEAVKNICQINWLNEFKKSSNFAHYTAQLIWQKGNFKKAMDEFMNIIEGMPSIKPEVSSMIRNLIKSSVPVISRASVNTVHNLSLEYSEKHDDYSVLGAFWFALFTSYWHEDKQFSVQLLLKHKGLQEYVSMHTPMFSKTFLICHNIADYQRLLECLLQCNMETASAQLLRALFDYYYKMGYTKGCDAVIKCCKALDMKLTSDQVYKYRILVGETQAKFNPVLKIVNEIDIKYKF